MSGVIGRKIGMTRIFTEEGISKPVTVVLVEPNVVAQVKTLETDGYNSIKITTGSKKANKLKKPEKGIFEKAGIEPGNGFYEFRVSSEDVNNYQAGSEVTLEMFKEGQMVDVSGTSKGKGFAGVVKRHNFRTQDATHGNSLSHRAPGSIGQNQSPGRVFKGKKMSGHMGAVKRTAQNLEVVKVDLEKKVLLIKGAVPGAPGSVVVVKSAVKANSTEAA